MNGKNDETQERQFQEGEVYWCTISEQIAMYDSIQVGRRPVLIISNEMNNRYSTNLTVVPLTKAEKKPLPVHHIVYIENPNGERTKSTVLCEQIFTISKRHMEDFYTKVSPDTLRKIREKCAIQIGIEW